MYKSLLEFIELSRAVPRVIAFYQGSPSLALRRAVRVWRREGLGGIRRRAGILLGGLKRAPSSSLGSTEVYGELPAANPEFNPKVSIIVPNYNHAPYLRRRLESIYQQNYQNFEVILLDDCSCDGSVEILNEYAQRFPDQTVCKFNASNSGSVFRQWKSGFGLATGDLVWVAESDDFCSDDFLVEQVKFFQNPAVMLSFCKTEFVRGDPPSNVWSLGEYLSALDIADWEKPFVHAAHALVCAGWAVKNILPNVSGALFRHPRNLSLLDDPLWLNLRMCGDWIFYLTIIRGGLVAYTPNATNYYRQHDCSTSQTTQKVDLYYKEHEVVASYLCELYRLDRSILDKQDDALYHHWCYHRGGALKTAFRQLYDPDRAWAKSTKRRPNLVMAVYALTAGGGETFPIFLAKLLYERGYAVTLLNCLESPSEAGVLKMLCPQIPRLELPRLELASAAFEDMGIDLVHSHHAWVDLMMANILIGKLDIKQVISMHGMYETMTPSQRDSVIPMLSYRINHFVYTAEKNLAAFSESFRESRKFTKISNALPVIEFHPIDLCPLGVAPEDFVLCMVARGIPDKGWAEAIQAVNYANKYSERRIHLLLIGDGPECDRLRNAEDSSTVHFLGFRQNIRDYFASCDMGFLPSRFKGESAPLVVIDCLLAGKPVLASDIGEIRSMLATQDGLAGEVFTLNEWALDPEKIGQAIVDLANNQSRYQSLCARVAAAAENFETRAMVESYEKVYRSTLSVA